MKAALVVILAGLTACSEPAQAERFDCSAFRGFQAQFACYDNLSRAPAPEPKETLKPVAAKPKAAAARQRKYKAE